MDELRPGLWTWSAPHPDWTPKDGGPDGWEQEVRCYAVRGADALVLVDPLDPPAGLAADAVVLTVAWHARSSLGLGVPVHAPAPDLEHVPGALPYGEGDVLPGGIEVLRGLYASEPVLWIPALGAVVAGDVLLGDADGGIRLEPQSWMPKGTTTADAAARLRHVLDLPLQLLLPTHGDPVLEDAPGKLRQALA